MKNDKNTTKKEKAGKLLYEREWKMIKAIKNLQ